MVEEKSLSREYSIEEKVKERDEQAKLVLQIFELAKKLKYCSYEVAEKVRHPDFIDQSDIDSIRKKMDYTFWNHCLEVNQVEKYLTTTDKEKLYEKLEEETPTFNFQNVMETIESFQQSKEARATNMIKKIYDQVTDLVFSKGNKHANREKRLQLGIPQTLRASIFYVYGDGLPSYVSTRNSRFNIIEDLERACYLVDGKLQPDVQKNITALTTEALRKDERFIDSPYLEMQIYKNGNVKIKFKSLETLKRFNYWGQKGNRLK